MVRALVVTIACLTIGGCSGERGAGEVAEVAEVAEVVEVVGPADTVTDAALDGLPRDAFDAPDPADAAAGEAEDGAVGDGEGDAVGEAEDGARGEDIAAETEGGDGDGQGDVGPVDAGCVEGEACVFLGYLPPCFEARCNGRAACQALRVEGCCRDDADCAAGDGGPCDTLRCVQGACTTLGYPGCCEVGMTGACNDGSALTEDRCDAIASRCAHCAMPCAARPPLFRATFDAATETPLALGMAVVDPAPSDALKWQRSDSAFAAGGGAVYFGDARCRTYYGGALDEACRPASADEADSARVSGSLLTPFLALPPESPALLTVWVRAAVEPLQGLGAAEPDVLRVVVEQLGAGSTSWTLGSTLDLGKSTDWAPLAVDLAPFRGQLVRVRFEFDTLDGEHNRFDGVWLDEIVIREACSEGGCCTDDSDCSASGACSAGACLLTAQGGARICADMARTPGELCTPCADDLGCADTDPCTDDRCLPSGACGHEVFCCLESDLLTETFDATLGALAASDDDPEDGVRWQVLDGAAWFGDSASATYAEAGPVSGQLTSETVVLPAATAARARLALELSLRLSTEWDLAEAGPDLAPLDNPAGLDRLTVEIVDGAFATVVWTSDLIGGTTHGQSLPVSIDLAPWRGRGVRLRIGFASGDETLNAFAGAFIEQLAVGVRCH